MYSNNASTKDAVLTGVNDILFDGVAGWFSSNIFAGTTYNLPGQSLVPGNGLKIFRAGYAIP